MPPRWQLSTARSRARLKSSQARLLERAAPADSSERYRLLEKPAMHVRTVRNSPAALSYYAMRKALGLIALSLPFVLGLARLC